MSDDGGVEVRHDVLRRHLALARHVPAALGGGLASRWLAPIVIARADDLMALP